MEMAHIFGVGMGGRRSADFPENVAWLCRFHHRTLDGVVRLTYDAVHALLVRLPDRPVVGESECSWYCNRRATTLIAMRPFCEIHEQIISGDNVSGRSSELGLALSFVIAKRNEAIGLHSE
jgi:hypothetical protein